MDDPSTIEKISEHLGDVRSMPDSVRDEFDAALKADTTQLGDAHRALVDDPGATVAPYHRALLATILEGSIPMAGTYRARAAVRIRALRLAVPGLSDTALDYLDSLLAKLEGPVAEGIAETPTQGPWETSGSIYVYSLSSYLRSPASLDGRTWLKIGRTNGSPRARVAAQGGRTTGLPEDPILLRVYRVDDGDAAVVERALHGALEALGHRRQMGDTTGREWFLTDLGALDALAGILGLEKSPQGAGDFIVEPN